MPESTSRDAFLDHLRAIAMIEVLVVHVFYWGSFLDERFEIIKSFFLFEMPLFFFVTGATNTLKPITSWKQYVEKRWSKMLIAYWIYAITAIIASLIVYLTNKDLNPQVTIENMIISWLIPNGYQISYIKYLPYSTWFILYYMAVIVLIPFLQKAKQKKPTLTGSLLFIGIIIGNILKLDHVQHIITYSMWAYIGMFHKELRQALQETKWKHYSVSIITGIAIILLILSTYGISLDMQANKFPPNTTFFVYGIIIMTLFLLLEKYINSIFNWLKKSKIGNNVITCYEKHSMTIFLYHAYIFVLTIPFVQNLFSIRTTWDEILKCIICFVLTFIGTTIITYLFKWTENISNLKQKQQKRS